MKRKLSDAEWIKVFAARCQTKQGRTISQEEHDLVEAAYKSDPRRYGEMDKEVFNATVPFGSSARAK